MLDSITLIHKLTSNIYKNKFLFLIILLVISAFIELLGVGILVPVVDLISDPKNLNDYPFLQDYLSGNENVIFLIVVLLVAIYAFKNLYLFLLSYYQSKLLANIQHTISTTLFDVIIRANYLDLTHQNKADIINTMSAELNALIGGYITPLLGLASELIVVSLMISVLLWYNFEVALVVLLFSVSISMLILFLLKSKLLAWGTKRQENSKCMIGVVDDFVGGVKEVKVYQKEAYILEKHSLFVKNFVTANRNIIIANSIPRFALEMVAVLSLLIVVILVYDEESVENILPIIVLYSAVAFRLMPGFNKIVTNINRLKYNYPCIQKVEQLFSQLKNENSSSNSTQCECNGYDIKIDNVTFSHNGVDKVLDGVSLEINENEKIGVIGGSGSGKTTLINMILGLISPSKGEVTIGDCNARNVPVNTFSYVPQEVFISDATIKENLVFDNCPIDIDDLAIKKSLQQAGLGDFISSIRGGIDARLGNAGAKISGGQKQRIGIARSLYHHSKIVVLDEATSALDFETEYEVVQSIYKSLTNRTVILVAHRISTLKDCDKVILLKDGNIVASGTYQYMTTENEEVRQLVKHGVI